MRKKLTKAQRDEKNRKRRETRAKAKEAARKFVAERRYRLQWPQTAHSRKQWMGD